jgi:hypothetical protein
MRFAQGRAAARSANDDRGRDVGPPQRQDRFSGFSAEVVPLDELQVVIDGVVGTRMPITESADNTSFGFAALSAPPITMEVRYDVGSSDSVLLRIQFHDYVCDTANPAPPCRD